RIRERDPGVGGAIGGAIGLGCLWDRLPMASAIVRGVDGFLQARGPTGVRIDEVDADRLRGRTGHFAPALAGLAGLPQSVFGDHPAESVVEEEERDRIVLERRERPVCAAV